MQQHSSRRPRLWGTPVRGSVTLEIAILGPVLLLAIFTTVQAGLWFYARSLALAAAQEGVAAARGYHADPASGPARARAFLTEHGADTLQAPQISMATTATRVRIQVTGHALSVLPGLPALAVSQAADGPRERLTDPP